MKIKAFINTTTQVDKNYVKYLLPVGNKLKLTRMENILQAEKAHENGTWTVQKVEKASVTKRNND